MRLIWLYFFRLIYRVSQKSEIFVIFSWIFEIFFKMTRIGVIWCGESIARTPEAWKRFLNPDSGSFNRNSTIEKLIKNHSLPLFRTREAFLRFQNTRNRFLALKTLGSQIFYQNPNCFHFRINTLPWIRIKEAFSHFGSARNRFPASNYTCRGHF